MLNKGWSCYCDLAYNTAAVVVETEMRFVDYIRVNKKSTHSTVEEDSLKPLFKNRLYCDLSSMVGNQNRGHSALLGKRSSALKDA